MNRRSFVEMVASLLGVSVAVASVPLISKSQLKQRKGPFCVEVYKPDKEKDRTLPIFNNMREASNYAYARQSLIKQNGGHTGKILITSPDGSVCEAMTWGPYWSQTISYVVPEKTALNSNIRIS